jgi:hypothetical protein
LHALLSILSVSSLSLSESRACSCLRARRERTYIGPTTAPWGDDQDVTFPHLAFLDLTSYFVQAYKNGGNYPNIEYACSLIALCRLSCSDTA